MRYRNREILFIYEIFLLFSHSNNINAKNRVIVSVKFIDLE